MKKLILILLLSMGSLMAGDYNLSKMRLGKFFYYGLTLKITALKDHHIFSDQRELKSDGTTCNLRVFPSVENRVLKKGTEFILNHSEGNRYYSDDDRIDYFFLYTRAFRDINVQRKIIMINYYCDGLFKIEVNKGTVDFREF